jgi:hypothetical protein
MPKFFFDSWKILFGLIVCNFTYTTITMTITPKDTHNLDTTKKKSQHTPKSIGFIIPSYVATQEHYNILKEGVQKIRQFHNWPIIIINDHSPWNINDLTCIPNIKIELSLKKGGGEMNPYLHYYLNHYFDIAIIIHDSMHLNCKLKNINEIDTVKFLRHFTIHRMLWEKIEEPITEYNKTNNIKNHDDLINHLVDITAKNANPKFHNFFATIYPQKNVWVGCWGVQSIITWQFLDKLHKKTNFLDFVDVIKNRRDRMAMESIFALACLYITDIDTLVDSYDGLYSSVKGKKLKSKYTTKIPMGR